MLVDLDVLRLDLEKALAADLGDPRATTIRNDEAGRAEAAQAGLGEVGAVVPFGALLGGAAPLDELVRSHRWGRLLSWLDQDPLLRTAFHHADRAVSGLMPDAAPYALVVHQASAPVPTTDAASLAGVLRSSKARYLCFEIVARLPALADALVPDEQVEGFEHWRRMHRLDTEATAIMRDWAAGCEARMTRRVDVTLGCDYEVVRDLMERHYGLFEVTR